jgi:hypothetical protein
MCACARLTFIFFREKSSGSSMRVVNLRSTMYVSEPPQHVSNLMEPFVEAITHESSSQHQVRHCQEGYVVLHHHEGKNYM